MRINSRLVFGGMFAAICTACMAPLAHAVTALSQYGQIQNVQNYSSNPFWSPGTQYNQRVMPSPVYATGPDVETADCQNVVSNLIMAQCVAQNNCDGMRVSDVRPAIMLELSRLPGHNYATACAGYIDSAFTTYKNQYANAVQPTTFPAATGTAPAQQQNNFKIQNPFPVQVPQWASDVQERKNELEQLQAQNGTGSEHLVKADFPTTINDVSFTDRMENLAAGYAPYKDAKAYNSLKVETQEEAMERQLRMAQLQKSFCEVRYGTNLNTLNADLATVKKCKADKIPITQCQTQGTYYY